MAVHVAQLPCILQAGVLPATQLGRPCHCILSLRTNCKKIKSEARSREISTSCLETYCPKLLLQLLLQETLLVITLMNAEEHASVIKTYSSDLLSFKKNDSDDPLCS